MRASFPLFAAVLFTLGAGHEAPAQQILIDPPLPSCTKGEPLTGHVVDLPNDQTYAIATYIYLDGYGFSGDFNGWLPKPYDASWPGGSPCTSLQPDAQDAGTYSFSVDVALFGCDEKATRFALHLIPENHPHCDSAWTKWSLENGDPQASIAPPLDSLQISRPCSTVDAFGYTWVVKDGGSCNPLAPGPCHFNPQNVSDDGAKLRLKTYYDNNNGRCEAAEISLTESFGYGTYVFTVDGSAEEWGQAPILGLFTWDVDVPLSPQCVNIHRELDFEFYQGEQLGCGVPQQNAQFAVQPVDCRVCTDKVYPFYMDYSTKTTHIMTWTATGVEFSSYYGDLRHDSVPNDLIATWTYSGPDNPVPGAENVRMNFYLAGGQDPANGEDVEIVISDFRYLANAEIDIKPGGGPNPVNPFSHGVVPVALLGLKDFDVTEVDRSTLAFGPDAAPPAHKKGGHLKDANHDGLTDLLLHFRTPQTGIAVGDTEACVTGEMLDGTPFEGCDSIKTRPNPRRWR